MKLWESLVWKLLFALLIIFIGGGILAFVLSSAVALSPGIANLIYCPHGSIAAANSEFDEQLPILCHDQNGVSVPPLTNAQSMDLQRKYFHIPSYIIMSILAIGWLIRPFLLQIVKTASNLPFAIRFIGLIMVFESIIWAIAYWLSRGQLTWNNFFGKLFIIGVTSILISFVLTPKPSHTLPNLVPVQVEYPSVKLEGSQGMFVSFQVASIIAIILSLAIPLVFSM